MRLSPQRRGAGRSARIAPFVGVALVLAATLSSDAAERAQRLIVSPTMLRIVSVQRHADAPITQPKPTARVKRLPKPPTATEAPARPGKAVRLALEIPAIGEPATPSARETNAPSAHGINADRVVPTSLEVATPEPPTEYLRTNVLRAATRKTSAVDSTMPISRPATPEPPRRTISSEGTRLRIRGR